jgi:hypothetical protein
MGVKAARDAGRNRPAVRNAANKSDLAFEETHRGY